MRCRKSLNSVLCFSLVLIILSSCNHKNSSFYSQREQDFNPGWKFVRDSLSGAEGPDFDDSGWRIVDLPHDWSIEDYPASDTAHLGPFDKNLPMGRDVGYLGGGTGWYRKTLIITPEHRDKEVIIYFDGVQSEMTLWVNGREAGHHVYGYTPFYFNITPYLNPPGEKNILAVRVYKPDRNSRWFTGAGIYRSVSISYLEPVHVDIWGISIITQAENKKDIHLKVDVVNDENDVADVDIVTHIISPKGKVVTKVKTSGTVPAGTRKTFLAKAKIKNPVKWDIDNPELYVAKVQVLKDDEVVDEYVRTFGIRSISFSAEKGFLLNGKTVLLKGGCVHHDNGLLGAAAFKAAEKRRVRIMKENGFNAIRTSHNPPSKYFLDACDELGILVIDESFDAWVKPKRPNDYHLYFKDWWKKDLEAMVLRDRNHPSVIMWSFGNEIQERADPGGLKRAREMIELIKSIDNTRPVTQAICRFWDNPGRKWDDTAPAFALLDVAGYNYQWQRYETDHEKYPDRIMFGSESFPLEAFDNWQKVKELPYVIGDFVWTGMDYIGESGIGHSVYTNKDDDSKTFLMPWPWYVAWCGDIDITGNKKNQSFYRNILWGKSKLEVLVHEPVPFGMVEKTSAWGWPNERTSWNWEGHEGDSLIVHVYTSYPAVRLELNGQLIGEQKVSENSRYTAVFQVPYEPGTLKATALQNGEKRDEKLLKTSGPLAQIRLMPETEIMPSGRGEIVYIRVEGDDGSGHLVADSEQQMTVKVNGVAELLAAGNGSPVVEGSIQDNMFRLFRGRGLIVIRSTGKAGSIHVSVETVDGLKGETSLEAKPLP